MAIQRSSGFNWHLLLGDCIGCCFANFLTCLPGTAWEDMGNQLETTSVGRKRRLASFRSLGTFWHRLFGFLQDDADIKCQYHNS